MALAAAFVILISSTLLIPLSFNPRHSGESISVAMLCLNILAVALYSLIILLRVWRQFSNSAKDRKSRRMEASLSTNFAGVSVQLSAMTELSVSSDDVPKTRLSDQVPQLEARNTNSTP